PPLPESLPKPVRALLMSMLAKDPKNRPANAIKLAEAAEAIRNGDISAAHAAVPGMLLFEGGADAMTAPVNIATAPTGVIGSEKNPTAATSALPVLGAAAAGAAAGGAAAAAAGDANGTPTRAGSTLSRADAALAAERSWDQEPERYNEPEDEPERRKRSPWTWPLIALILLVLFAVAGILLSQAGFLSPGQNPAATTSGTPSRSVSTSSTPTPTQTSQTPTPTPTPTQTTPEAINLIPDAYLGKQFSDVRSELIALGLQVDGKEVFNPATPGTVTDLNPTGPVQPGRTITVTYSKGPKQISVPDISTGSSESEVQSAIEKAGLRWQKGADEPGEPGQDAGTFVRSEPESGREVDAGSVVTYHLSEALLPTESATPTPTPTPSGSPTGR
ncbi:MAG TPA: PASTA domain-containing protein, partial [Arthrobacter sp.]|nr:PASTA domain-containing protein [Arthrobacter sp.]